MRLIPILLLLTMVSLSSQAQEKTREQKLSFESGVAVAALNGSATSTLHIQTVHGIALKNSFAGAGVGIDYYRYRTIPVFLQVRQEIGKRKNRFFLYTDGGYNIDWLTDRTKEPDFGQTVKYKGGWYYDLGAGYKVGLKDEKALLFSIGYSYKEVQRKVYYKTCLVAGGICMDDVARYEYTMSRIALRGAFRF